MTSEDLKISGEQASSPSETTGSNTCIAFVTVCRVAVIKLGAPAVGWDSAWIIIIDILQRYRITKPRLYADKKMPEGWPYQDH